MRRIAFLILGWVACSLLAFTQTGGLKTNLTHWATGGTINGGYEVALNRGYTLELAGGINPFTFKENKKFKHWIIQPEIRYWPCESFNGHFFGFHALASEYNVGGLDVPLGRLSRLKEHRYEGFAFGGGLSYGYQWVLSPRWNFELGIGAGYAYLTYDQFACVKCGEKIASEKDHYLGVTKAAISLIFLIH